MENELDNFSAQEVERQTEEFLLLQWADKRAPSFMKKSWLSKNGFIEEIGKVQRNQPRPPDAPDHVVRCLLCPSTSAAVTVKAGTGANYDKMVSHLWRNHIPSLQRNELFCSRMRVYARDAVLNARQQAGGLARDRAHPQSLQPNPSGDQPGPWSLLAHAASVAAAREQPDMSHSAPYTVQASMASGMHPHHHVNAAGQPDGGRRHGEGMSPPPSPMAPGTAAAAGRSAHFMQRPAAGNASRSASHAQYHPHPGAHGYSGPPAAMDAMIPASLLQSAHIADSCEGQSRAMLAYLCLAHPSMAPPTVDPHTAQILRTAYNGSHIEAVLARHTRPDGTWTPHFASSVYAGVNSAMDQQMSLALAAASQGSPAINMTLNTTTNPGTANSSGTDTGTAGCVVCVLSVHCVDQRASVVKGSDLLEIPFRVFLAPMVRAAPGPQGSPSQDPVIDETATMLLVNHYIEQFHRITGHVYHVASLASSGDVTLSQTCGQITAQPLGPPQHIPTVAFAARNMVRTIRTTECVKSALSIHRCIQDLFWSCPDLAQAVCDVAMTVDQRSSSGNSSGTESGVHRVLQSARSGSGVPQSSHRALTTNMQHATTWESSQSAAADPETLGPSAQLSMETRIRHGNAISRQEDGSARADLSLAVEAVQESADSAAEDWLLTQEYEGALAIGAGQWLDAVTTLQAIAAPLTAVLSLLVSASTSVSPSTGPLTVHLDLSQSASSISPAVTITSDLREALLAAQVMLSAHHRSPYNQQVQACVSLARQCLAALHRPRSAVQAVGPWLEAVYDYEQLFLQACADRRLPESVLSALAQGAQSLTAEAIAGTTRPLLTQYSLCPAAHSHNYPFQDYVAGNIRAADPQTSVDPCEHTGRQHVGMVALMAAATSLPQHGHGNSSGNSSGTGTGTGLRDGNAASGGGGGGSGGDVWWRSQAAAAAAPPSGVTGEAPPSTGPLVFPEATAEFTAVVRSDVSWLLQIDGLTWSRTPAWNEAATRNAMDWWRTAGRGHAPSLLSLSKHVIGLPSGAVKTLAALGRAGQVAGRGGDVGCVGARWALYSDWEGGMGVSLDKVIAGAEERGGWGGCVQGVSAEGMGGLGGDSRKRKATAHCEVGTTSGTEGGVLEESL